MTTTASFHAYRHRNNWHQVREYYRSVGIPARFIDFASVHQYQEPVIDELVAGRLPRRVLEVGTFVGLATSAIALSNPASYITTVDPNYPICVLGSIFGVKEKKRVLEYAREAFHHFSISKRITILEGFLSSPTTTYWDRYLRDWNGEPGVIDHEAVSVVGNRIAATAPFDAVFIDADHSSAAVYNDLSLVAPYLAPKGLIALDDVAGLPWGPAVVAGVRKFVANNLNRYRFSIRRDIGVLSRVD